jgi:hypothetical protein
MEKHENCVQVAGTRLHEICAASPIDWLLADTVVGEDASREARQSEKVYLVDRIYLVGLVRCLSGARSGHNRMEQRWSQFPSKDLTAFGRRRDDVPFHLNDENVVSMLSMLPTFINIILFQSSTSVDCYIILIPMCERIWWTCHIWFID